MQNILKNPPKTHVGNILPLRTDNEADIYDFDETNPTDIRNIRNTNLNESDFGDVSEIL